MKEEELQRPEEEEQLRWNRDCLTCFHTLLLEVRAAAEVVLAVAVAPASGRLHLLQLVAAPPTGASRRVPLWAHWGRGDSKEAWAAKEVEEKKKKSKRLTINNQNIKMNDKATNKRNSGSLG